MKRLLFSALGLTVTCLATHAYALKITCPKQKYLVQVATNASSDTEDTIITLDPNTGKFMIPDPQSASGMANFSLSGHPLRYSFVKMEDNSSCQVDHPETLFRMMAPAKIQAVLANWDKWVQSRPKPCSVWVQAEAYVQPNADKVALVLHGVASNPLRMRDTVKVFLDAGYNVLVPRLAGHFDINLHDLDKVAYMDWLNDANQALSQAVDLSYALELPKAPKVTVAGFSLGGLLASWLSIQYQKVIDRMILISPAWRISTATSVGLFFAWVGHTNYNKVFNEPESCTVKGGYVSTPAGHQVDDLTGYVEGVYHGNNDEITHPQAGKSAFQQINIPHIIFTSSQDEAIDPYRVLRMCRLNVDHMCTGYNIPNLKHEDMPTAMDKYASPRKTMGQVMREFLNHEFNTAER